MAHNDSHRIYFTLFSRAWIFLLAALVLTPALGEPVLRLATTSTDNSGLLAPDSAQVCPRNTCAPWKSAQRLLRRTTVYLHQEPYMFDRSVADNVAYGLRNQELPQAQIRHRVEQALDRAGFCTWQGAMRGTSPAARNSVWH